MCVWVCVCHEMYDQNSEIQVLLEFMDGGSLEGKHIPQEQPKYFFSGLCFFSLEGKHKI